MSETMKERKEHIDGFMDALIVAARTGTPGEIQDARSDLGVFMMNRLPSPVPPHAAAEDYRCSRCGGSTFPFSSHTCHPTAPTQAALEATFSSVLIPRIERIEEALNSKPAPEMPEEMADEIEHIRERMRHHGGYVSLRVQIIIWLADRVGELERQVASLLGQYRGQEREINSRIETQERLQSSAAQETKRFDALWHALPFDQRHRFGGDPVEARQAIDAALSRPAEIK